MSLCRERMACPRASRTPCAAQGTLCNRSPRPRYAAPPRRRLALASLWRGVLSWLE